MLGPVGGSFSTSRNLSGTEQSWEAPPICSLEREALGFLAHYLFRGFSALQQSASMNTDWRNTLPFPPGSGLPGALQAVRGKRGQVGEDARRGGCLKLGSLQASLSSEQRTPGVEADFWGVCEDPFLGQLPGGMAPGSLCVWRSPEVLWTQEGVHSRCRESGSPAWHVAATLTQTVLELTGPQMSHWGSKKMDFGGRTLEACFSGLGFAPLSSTSSSVKCRACLKCLHKDQVGTLSSCLHGAGIGDVSCDHVSLSVLARRPQCWGFQSSASRPTEPPEYLHTRGTEVFSSRPSMLQPLV